MSARSIAIMNGRLAALDAEQESIAQTFAVIPNIGNIYSVNYRTAATQANIKRNSDVQAMISEHLEGLKTQLLLNVTNTKTELQSKIDGVMTNLRKEIDILTDGDKGTNKKLILLDDNTKKMAKDIYELYDDVKYVRHELNAMGSRLTTMHHLITNQNKSLLARIEALENSLKTPPPKSEFQWFEFFMIIGFLVISFLGFFLKKKEVSGLLMIDY